MKNNNVKIIWEINIQTDHFTEYKGQINGKFNITNIAISRDNNIGSKRESHQLQQNEKESCKKFLT